MLAGIAGTILIAGFVLLIATEIANEFKARLRLGERNERKRKEREAKSHHAVSP